MGLSQRHFGVRGLMGCSYTLSILLTMSCNRAGLWDMRGSSEQDIRALDREWSKTAGARDLEGTVAFYADDALLLPPDEPLPKGKSSIRASWAGTLAAFDTISSEVKTIEVAKSGELAYVTVAWPATQGYYCPRPGQVAGSLEEAI